ncbi:MAG: hypothetical protein K8R59_15775, partial [Thermoanaerobaculales bacterium]|nr:hypothetical protein [Thermoanaerobaculales bacterium]
MKNFLNEERLAYLEFKVAGGENGLESRLITNPRIQKPGLALAGFLPYVKPGRVQILGESEYSFLRTLGEDEANCRIISVLKSGIPAIVSTKGNVPSIQVLDVCDELEIPFLVTQRQTSDAIEGVSAFLENALAPRTQIHGVLVNVFSSGTLIIGDAGIGKSECALELIYRGHRLVADDLVVVRRCHRHGLRGEAHPLLLNILELRGVGIIDVRKHFGMTASSPTVDIALVIELVKL